MYLGTEKMREHPEKYEPKGKCYHMMDWLKHNKLSSIIFECTALKPNKIVKSKWTRYMTHDINIQVKEIFHDTMSVPPMYTFTMIKLSDDYRSIPLSLIKKYDSYGMNI